MFKLDGRLLSWLALLLNSMVLVLVVFWAALAVATAPTQPAVLTYSFYTAGNLGHGGTPTPMFEPVRDFDTPGTATVRTVRFPPL